MRIREIHPVLTLTQMFRFGVVGILSAVLDVGTVWMLSGTNLPDEVSLSVGFFLGLVVNYILHSVYTFERSVQFSPRVAKFAATAAANYAITLTTVDILTRYVGLTLVFAKCLSLLAVATVGFVSSKFWIFN